MTDPAWNAPLPALRTGFPGWLKALGGLLAILVLLFTLLISYGQVQRRQAWPLARAVATRLATDDGALDLYRKNPALARSFPTEQSFLEAIRPFRAGLVLPEQPPAGNRLRFRVQSSPGRLRVRVRGEGGTWMDLTLLQGSLFGPQPQGEGLAALWLADTRERLRGEADPERLARAEERWQTFRATAAPLATEAGARELLGHSGLETAPAGPAAFLALRLQRQAALANLPTSFSQASGHLTVIVHGGLFRREVRMRYEFEGGGSLTLVWRNDRLEAVGLD